MGWRELEEERLREQLKDWIELAASLGEVILVPVGPEPTGEPPTEKTKKKGE